MNAETEFLLSLFLSLKYLAFRKLYYCIVGCIGILYSYIIPNRFWDFLVAIISLFNRIHYSHKFLLKSCLHFFRVGNLSKDVFSNVFHSNNTVDCIEMVARENTTKIIILLII